MLSSFQFFRVLMTLSYSFDKISQLWLRGWRATNGFYVTLRWGGRPFRFANPNLPKINEYSRQWLCENILCDRYWKITAWMKKKVEIPLDKSSHRYLKWIRSERKARSNFNLFWWKKLQSAEVYSFGFGYLVAVRYAKRSPRTYFMQIQLTFFSNPRLKSCYLINACAIWVPIFRESVRSLWMPFMCCQTLQMAIIFHHISARHSMCVSD